MKSQSGIKRFFEKIGTLILLAVLLFACTTSPEAPQSSVAKPTKTKTSLEPNSPENDNPPIKTFSLQNANKIAPADVLEEVAFGGRGEGDGCAVGDFGSPLVDDGWSSKNGEWLAPIKVITCGWWSDSQVEVTIEQPDGNNVTETAKVEETMSGIPSVQYEYAPHTDSSLGEYTFYFKGNSGNVQYSVNVSMPNGPRIYYVNNIQSYYLYGFSPNERIRFFLYDTQTNDGSGNTGLTAWDEYNVDSNGKLIIKANEDDFYFVIGESTGPISTGLMNASVIVNKSSPSGNQSSSNSCSGALPSRLEVGKYAYVSTDPPLDNRVREGAGKDNSIIGYIGTGSTMKILDGPKCVDGWTWWKVQSIKKPDLVGWTSEGDDVYWLIPCDSLNSCP